MRHVLGPGRLLGQPASEGGSPRVLAVRGEQVVQTIDIADPDAGTSRRELGQVLERRTPELEQVLALQIALSALPRDGRHVLRAMLGQRRFRPGFEQPLMDGFVPACDDPDPIAIQQQRPRDPDRVGWHRVGMRVMHDGRRRPDHDGHAEGELIGGDFHGAEPRALVLQPHGGDETRRSARPLRVDLGPPLRELGEQIGVIQEPTLFEE